MTCDDPGPIQPIEGPDEEVPVLAHKRITQQTIARLFGVPAELLAPAPASSLRDHERRLEHFAAQLEQLLQGASDHDRG